MFSLVLFFLFLQKQAAFHIGIDINVNRGHPDGFKADYAAAIREFLFISNVKMGAGKTINLIFHIFLLLHQPYLAGS